ncbi:MAG: hemerythrin, partial [Nitrospirae bacterium]|nr:hemerythrin [Nitrospirota bacterium]
MTLVTWDSTWSVNVKEIDAQHQKLIGIVNDLHEAIKAGKARDV